MIAFIAYLFWYIYLFVGLYIFTKSTFANLELNVRNNIMIFIAKKKKLSKTYTNTIEKIKTFILDFSC